MSKPNPSTLGMSLDDESSRRQRAQSTGSGRAGREAVVMGGSSEAPAEREKRLEHAARVMQAQENSSRLRFQHMQSRCHARSQAQGADADGEEDTEGADEDAGGALNFTVRDRDSREPNSMNHSTRVSRTTPFDHPSPSAVTAVSAVSATSSAAQVSKDRPPDNQIHPETLIHEHSRDSTQSSLQTEQNPDRPGSDQLLQRTFHSLPYFLLFCFAFLILFFHHTIFARKQSLFMHYFVEKFGNLEISVSFLTPGDLILTHIILPGGQTFSSELRDICRMQKVKKCSLNLMVLNASTC